VPERPVETASSSPPAPRPITLAGGVVAHNDESRIERSVRALLGQSLPEGVSWGRIWIVASGCTDRTTEIASALAAEEPRLGVIIEPERRGKASAIREVFRRAEGSALVVLNSDATPEPNAVRELLRRVEGRPPPFAVMARPVVPDSVHGDWTETMRWMWDLHHELHLRFLAAGRGTHLSDELLLFSLPGPPELPSGVINDGSYFAVWLAQHGGGRWYAPEARVAIEVPNSRDDHLRQRRRIHVGNAQVRSLLGAAPTTLPRYFLQEPTAALAALRTMVGRPSGPRHFLRVAEWEVVAHLLAAWDRLPPRRDHVRWQRIRGAAPLSAPSASGGASDTASVDLPQRVGALLQVARNFSTGVPVEELYHLLPQSPPIGSAEFRAWLEAHPELARIDDGRVFAADDQFGHATERSLRGVEFRAAANRLVDGPLAPLRRWIRFVGVTGSTAYGDPDPQDDLDLLLVTRSGSLWWSLAIAYGLLRLDRLRGPGRTSPPTCLNYVLDDSSAPAEFSTARGLLFAREALSVKPILGDEYYRGLLKHAPWIAGEIPRLYAERTATTGDASPRPAPWGVRAANAILFPLLATYVHLTALRKNATSRRAGARNAAFQVITQRQRLAFVSQRFEQLRSLYEPRPEGAAPTGRVTGSSQFSTAR